MMQTPRTPSSGAPPYSRVIQPPAKVVERPPRKQRAHLGRHRAGQRLAQHVAHKPAHAFAGLQRHVAHKAVADDHVGLAAEDVAAFNVADEVDRQRLQQRKRLARQVVALGLFFADREQAHARLRESSARCARTSRPSPRIVRGCAPCNPHWRPRPAARTDSLWQSASASPAPADRRPAARPAPSWPWPWPRRYCRRSQSPPLCPRAPASGPRASSCRVLVRTACAAFSSIPMRSEAWWMTMGRSSFSRCSSSRSRSSASRPNQVDPHRQSPAGEDRSLDLRLWSFVGTYGVKRDVDEHGASVLLGGFLDVQHGAALVCRRTWRRRDGAASSRGSWGTLKGRSPSESRGSGEGRCGALNGAFSDSAWCNSFRVPALRTRAVVRPQEILRAIRRKRDTLIPSGLIFSGLYPAAEP